MKKDIFSILYKYNYTCDWPVVFLILSGLTFLITLFSGTSVIFKYLLAILIIITVIVITIDEIFFRIAEKQGKKEWKWVKDE